MKASRLGELPHRPTEIILKMVAAYWAAQTSATGIDAFNEVAGSQTVGRDEI